MGNFSVIKLLHESSGLFEELLRYQEKHGMVRQGICLTDKLKRMNISFHLYKHKLTTSTAVTRLSHTYREVP
jgi:hypothetical protein